MEITNKNRPKNKQSGLFLSVRGRKNTKFWIENWKQNHPLMRKVPSDIRKAIMNFAQPEETNYTVD